MSEGHLLITMSYVSSLSLFLGGNNSMDMMSGVQEVTASVQEVGRHINLVKTQPLVFPLLFLSAD